VDDVLASVRGVVDLSPHEALDEAQDFLRRQGYSVTYRTSTTLTVKRQVSENAGGQESIFKLIVMALPQSGGGVQIKVRGNDREAVRDHQATWLKWSETLPKREPEQPQAAATMVESVMREIVGEEAPRHTTAADNDMRQRRYCTNCGHQLAENDRFCANCGTPVHEAAHMPTPEAERPGVPPAAERNTWERLSSKQRIPITVSPEQAMEELRQFFALDFRTGRDYDLVYSDWGLKAKEVFRTSPLVLVVNLVLTLVTLGLWLIVWILIELVQRGQIQKISVDLLQEEDSEAYIVQLTGSDSWVQTTEAFVRRNLVNGGEVRPISR